jgi:2-succinyl-5-enolpyruvyl-6-hydroxy-3-cyclohexene-1-carboxylate synthase
MFGLEYAESNTAEELENHLPEFFAPSEKPKVLEIFTPRKLNDEVLLEYFSFMKY